jgi:hypothetical protein
MRGRSGLTITAHSAIRMRQRGYQLGDFETIESIGTLVADGILLRKRDTEVELSRLAAELKRIRQGKAALQIVGSAEGATERDIIRRMERLRSLAGTFIPTVEGCALSIYRPCNRRLKYMLHGRSAYRRRLQRRPR